MQFSDKMPLYFFYTMVQKSQKWPKTQIKGSCLFKLLLKEFGQFVEFEFLTEMGSWGTN